LVPFLIKFLIWPTGNCKTHGDCGRLAHKFPAMPITFLNRSDNLNDSLRGSAAAHIRKKSLYFMRHVAARVPVIPTGILPAYVFRLNIGGMFSIPMSLLISISSMPVSRSRVIIFTTIRIVQYFHFHELFFHKMGSSRFHILSLCTENEFQTAWFCGRLRANGAEMPCKPIEKHWGNIY
jgi:hypothetical protein